MTKDIVQTSNYVTLIGAGQSNKALFDDALAFAPYLVAADGGAEMSLKYGKTPKKVIGDFDSLTQDIQRQLPAGSLHRISEQDTTDFEKCLRCVKAPMILAVGFLGRRLDHQLAAFNALAKFPDQRCILIGDVDIVFHLPPKIALDLAPGSRVSLYPLDLVSGHSTGLKWPIDGLEFAPGGRIGTSNEATGGPVALSMNGPGMLAILPRESLGAAVEGLGALPDVPGE